MNQKERTRCNNCPTPYIVIYIRIIYFFWQKNNLLLFPSVNVLIILILFLFLFFLSFCCFYLFLICFPHLWFNIISFFARVIYTMSTPIVSPAGPRWLVFCKTFNLVLSPGNADPSLIHKSLLAQLWRRKRTHIYIYIYLNLISHYHL